MLKIEKKLIEIIQNKSHILFSIFITIISIWIRFEGKENISRDMNVFLLPWYEQIKENGGLLSLQYQVGNYNILYQTIIALFTYLDIKPIYIYKLFSIIFDYALAYTIADNLRSLLNRGIVFFNMVYATVLFLPTLILNSAYWGQCDVIYTFFVILFLFSLYSEKYVKAFVWLGLAFAFKMQAIFILPFALTYYFYKKKFSILYFMVSFITFMSTGIVGYVFGRSIFDPITIYMGQTDTYQSMWLNITSFWQLLGDNYEVFSKFAVFITVIICGIGFYFVLIGKKQIDTLEQFFQTALWFVWVMIFFLPAMHERYTFMLDILFVILSFISVKYIKYACLSVCLSLATYGTYLCNTQKLDILYVFIFFGALVYYTYEIFMKNEDFKISIVE